VVFIFSAAFVWNISQSKKNSARYYHTCTQDFTYNSRYCCKLLVKLWFSPQIFEISKNIKYVENPASESRDVTCGRTDRHDETNSRFSKFSKLLYFLLQNSVEFLLETIFRLKFHKPNILNEGHKLSTRKFYKMCALEYLMPWITFLRELSNPPSWCQFVGRRFRRPP